MGKLYLVATPIGNLEDITVRAIRVLREVSLVAAEDTRKTRLLLRRYGIDTPTTSYFEHNKLTKLEAVIARLRTDDVALVSDAGMPGIADPGYELVRAALAANIEVVPVPGASAIIAAVAASGLPTDQFVYVGFLPRQPGERRRRLAAIAEFTQTIVAYEAPHRLLASLGEMLDVLGDRQIAVARELTKIHEEIVRGSVSEVLEHFAAHAPRGEFTLVIAGRVEQRHAIAEGEIDERLNRLLAEGLSPRRAAAVLARESGLPAREIYRRHTLRH